MPLELKPPSDDPPQQEELTLADIDQLHRKIDRFVGRKLYPSQPPEVLRALLVRGQCLCAAARRLKEQR
jgi:hypothetical protein